MNKTIKSEKQALVPRLRFSEFRDAGEWDSFPLSKISERITDKVGCQKPPAVSITAGLGFVSQVEKFGRDISGQQYKNYIHLKKGQFSYNKGNSRRFPQGCIYQLTEFEQVAAPSAFISFKFNDGFVPEFFKGYFDSNFHGYQLLKFITSGARSDGLLNIRSDDFFSIRLPTPKEKEEQQKIADCLSSLDALIAAQADKVDALKTHKKGLMQQLFPREGETVPRLRFPEFRGAGEWGETTLGKVVDIRSGYSPSRYNLSGEARYPFLKVEDLNNCEKYQASSREYSNDSLGVVPPGSIIFPKRGASILNNKVRLNTVEVLMDTNLMAITSRKDVLAEFLYCIVVTEGLSKIADTSTIPQINNKHIIPYVVRVPGKAEQQEIADCLSSIDELIAAHTEKFEALKVHKKGLMQQLFPSPEAVSA